MFSVLSPGQPFAQIIISADERSVNEKLAAWAASFVIQTLLFLTGRIHRFYKFNWFVYKLYSAFTGLEIAPNPSISTSTRSPGLSGPAPAGVPVKIRAPGSSVITDEM